MLRHWLRSFRKQHAAHTGRSIRNRANKTTLQLEALEDRVVPAAVLNDMFALASEHTSLNGWEEYSNGGYGGEPGEPHHGSAAPLNSAWWKIPAEDEGTMIITAKSWDFDTTLTVYTGTSLANLTEVAFNDDNPDAQNSTDSEVSFDTVAGILYYVAVDSYGSGGGIYYFNAYVDPNPFNNNYANSTNLGGGTDITVTGQIVGADGEPGEPTYHAGAYDGELNSVWYKWTAPYSEDVRIRLNPNYLSTLAVYTGNAVNALSVVDWDGNPGTPGGPLSNEVNFTTVAGTTYSIAVDSYGLPQGSFTLYVQLAPPNDDFVKAATLTGFSAAVQGHNGNASGQTGEPDHANLSQNADGELTSAWWKWTAPASGQAFINTLGSDFNTTLAVYTGSAVNSLTEVASNNDYGGTDQSSVSFSAVAGTTYRIAVDGVGYTTGNIHLNVTLRPANNQFVDAFTLTGFSASTTGYNTNATGQVGEPDHADVSYPLNSVWWKWTAPASGQAIIDTYGSNLDTTMGVYTGNSVGALTQVAANDDATQFTSDSRVIFNTVAGTTYRIAVDGFEEDTGNINLNLKLNPVNDAFASATTLTGYTAAVTGFNVNSTGQTGEPYHAGNIGVLNSVWWKWTAPAGGHVTIDTFGSDFDTLLAVYTGSAVNGLTSIAYNDDSYGSSQSRVEFTSIAGATYRIAVDGYAAGTGMIDLNLDLKPVNDDFAAAATLTGFSLSETGWNNNASGQIGEPNHAGNSGVANSVWWQWTAPATGQTTITTFGSDFDTTLAVYTGDSVSALTWVASNDDTIGTTQSRVSFAAVAGTTYRIAVDGYSNNVGNIDLNLELRPVNDNFETAFTLSGSTASVTGHNTNATGQAGEPNHAGTSGVLNSVWWQWTAPAAGQASIDTFGSNFDTTLAVYTGIGVAALIPVAANDDTNGTALSQVSFASAAGTTYRIAIDGYGSAHGNIAMHLSLNHLPVAGIHSQLDGTRNQLAQFTFTALDPDLADQAAGFTYLINWGDGATQSIGPGLSGAGTQAAHSYNTVGVYQVSVAAMDQNGAVSALATRPITIRGAQLPADPADPAKTALFVSGTSGNDTIVLTQAKLGGGPMNSIQVLINGVSEGTFKPTGNLIVYGQGGDDAIAVDAKVSRPAILYGNAGNDTISSGGAASILLGGAGNDTLTGNQSRDILIGGAGADTLNGGRGDDILIAGASSFDDVSTANQQALCALMAEWSRTDLGYLDRINHLTGATPGGLNGSSLLKTVGAGATVFDDAVQDKLTGSAGQDWFFANSAGAGVLDELIDKLATELVQDV